MCMSHGSQNEGSILHVEEKEKRGGVMNNECTGSYTAVMEVLDC